MSHDDRIALRGMRFSGRHGVTDAERGVPQPIEVDVELSLDLAPAGTTDDLADTVDYAAVFDTCRAIVEERSFRLLEAIAEALATATLARTAAGEVRVVVRKLEVPVAGELAHAAVEIRRTRSLSG